METKTIDQVGQLFDYFFAGGGAPEVDPQVEAFVEARQAWWDAEEAKDAANPNRHSPSKWDVCGRCNGQGKLRQYEHVQRGDCFECWGACGWWVPNENYEGPRARFEDVYEGVIPEGF